MAATESTNIESTIPSSLGSPLCADVNQEISNDGVMERLRARASHCKSWGEMSKSLRLSITEKRNVLDSADRAGLQKVLDTLQKSIKVTSLQSMVERLDSISRQQGLKFTWRNNTECYISSDMFYVEILLEQNGEVSNQGVKMALTGDGKSGPVDCPELTKVLRSGNFTEFTKHLEGLASIYQLNASNQQKAKAYSALEALETDLSTLAQIQSTIKEPSNLVHKSPVGILQKRRGGFPMKLTYFISPYDLLDVESKTSIPLTMDAVIEKELGHSVTVCIESSTLHKLQTMSLITITNTQKGESLPSSFFAAFNNLNSTTLPASFVLKLPDPIPMSVGILKKIQGVTKISDSTDFTNCQSLLSVIINSTSNGKIQSSPTQDLCVTLPDQQHCYNVKSNSDLQGVLVSVIPFTHPTFVPQILVFLRQQMLFNTVISSCVRPSSKIDLESAFKFDIHAYSTNHIQVTFVHPLDESLAAVDLDLTDITSVKCKIYTLGLEDTLCTDEYASKVMQRCLSIPITMRAVIRKAQWQQQQMKPSNHADMYCAAVGGGTGVQYLSHLPNYGNSLTNGSSAFSGDFSNLASRMCNKPVEESEMNDIPLNAINEIETPNCVQSDLLGVNMNQCNALPNVISEKNSAIYVERNLPVVKNPLLGNLLAQSGNQNIQTQQYQHSKHPNTMLMSMLSDVPSGKPFPSLGQNENCGKIRKQRKRKAADAQAPLRSPKRKASEDDKETHPVNPDIESTNNSSLGFELNCTVTSPFPHSALDNISHHVGRAMTPLGIKSESQSHIYPQRSASTDSYLIHNFQAQQALSLNDNSRLSEGGTSNNPEIFSNQPALKNQYLGVQNVLDFHQGSTLSHNDVSQYSESAGGSLSDLDIEDECSFDIDNNNQSVHPTQNRVRLEKAANKFKKYKNVGDLKKESGVSAVSKSQDTLSSEESSSGDFCQKSSNEASPQDNSLGEDLSIGQKSHQVHRGHPLVISRSFKIAMSGNSHKVSRSDIKIKQREGRRSISAGDEMEQSAKKKNEAKKERKRKRAESADSVSDRSPVRSFPLNVDSSLMPPPSSSSSDSSPAISVSDAPPLRPITLNMKPSPTSTTMSSPSRSKSPLPTKKNSSNTCLLLSTSPSKSTAMRNNSDRIMKPSHQQYAGVNKTANLDSEGRVNKMTLSSIQKSSSKHKQSSSSKTGTSHLGSNAGRSSPGKMKSLKLKTLGLPNLPSPTTITPVLNKSSNISSVQLSKLSSAISIMPVSLLDPPSPPDKQGANNKGSKSALRSRKGSLSAVIDKLRVTATTNAQHPFPIGTEILHLEACGMRPELSLERKDCKIERKESTKESKDLSKSGEGKSKYFASDQFTVKQSSQGIKLTVTKTRSSDGSSKLGKIKALKTSVSSSSHASKTVSTASFGTKLTQTLKKSLVNSVSHSAVTPKTSVAITQMNANPAHIVSCSGNQGNVQTKSSSSSSPIVKPSKTISSSSSQNKSTPSSKTLVKTEKRVVPAPVISIDVIDKVLANMPNLNPTMMPPPPVTSKANVGEIPRPLPCTSTTKRNEEHVVQLSPRNTPIHTESYGEESDGEKAFRLLLEKSKPEVDNSSDHNTPISKSPPDFVGGALNFNEAASVPKVEMDERTPWVSSSTDIKSSLPWVSQSPAKLHDIAIIAGDAMTNVFSTKPIAHTEVSSSNKHDSMNIIAVGNSIEEISKIVSPFSKPSKLSKRVNTPSEDDSSPEDRLFIIDYSDNSRQKSPNKKWSSPHMEPTALMFNTDDKSDKCELSPGAFMSKTTYQPSPSKSPAQVFTSPSNHSSSRPSPVNIDDELMNEALMTIGK